MIGTPDPLPLALRVLGAHAATVPVAILVFAPEGEAEVFDGWGRPLAETWATRILTVPQFAQRVHLCADPAEQAARIAAAAAACPEPETMLGIGIADPELLPLLENALARAGIAAFNPEGRPRRHDGLYSLLAALADFAAEPGFRQVAALARCPDVLEWLRGRLGGAFSPAAFLAELDQFGAEHLPPTLAAARGHAGESGIAPALTLLAELRATLTRGVFPANAAAALMEIFAGRELDAAGELAESAEAWMAGLRELGAALALDAAAKLTVAEAWQFALGAFADEVRAEERPAGAVDLLGWLELLWDDAPHLIVAGLNDGRVPSAIVGDGFLPETLRARLGLKRNAERFACDAYLLAAIAASRHGAGGRLEVLLGKTSAAGDPLRPSRLLLRCADEELPARVAQLFRPVAATRPSPPWARAWQLRPRTVPAPTQLSVTALRDWLACPFRFYLKHALRLGRVEPEKAELDARDFGTLLHGALQQLGEAAALRDCTEAARLREFLLERLEGAVRRRYGAELTLPLVVQFESARQRLRAAAEIEAQARAEGWRTVRVEWQFEFPFGGLVVKGKIDRIDQHADGRVRVLDYKTGDAATEPVAAHLRAVRSDEHERPEWLRTMNEAGKARAWADLQLPLYRRAVAAEFGDAVGCGYFNLPKAAGETAVTMWDGFSRETQAAAERCAEGVVAAVAAGEFWPPRELAGREADWDEFAELFHGRADASIWREARA
jgi:ATP-dependent helicase/nuclease subunit B